MNPVTPVAVIGAGPCGMLMALLLARLGVPCNLFEKKSGISSHPKAMSLTRRTCEIFRQQGLFNLFAAASLRLEEGMDQQIWSRTLTGEILGRVPLVGMRSECTPVWPLHCPQTETERILLEALRQEPLVSIHFESEVENFNLCDFGGELRTSSGGEFAFSWLVAADGAGSGTRKKLHVGTAGPGDMGHFLNVMFRAELGSHLQGREAILYNILYEGGYEIFVSINGHDRWLMHHFLLPGETREDFPAERLRDIIRNAAGLPDLEMEILGVSPWVMSPKIAQSFRMDRVFLVGDAAARLSPAGGLGMNTGLQSVHNLAWKLAEVLHGRAGEALLETYCTERQRFSSEAMQTTNQNSGEVFAIVSEAEAGHWDAVKGIIAHSRRGGSHLGEDLGFRYREGAFIPDGSAYQEPRDRQNDFFPQAFPGCRAPHVMVRAGQGEIPLADLLPMEMLLLAGSKADRSALEAAGLPVFQEGSEFRSEEFAEVYGMEPNGAVLIRPDGIVGARWAEGGKVSSESIQEALSRVLCRS